MIKKINRKLDTKALVSHLVHGDGLERCRICMGDTNGGHAHLGDTVMMNGDKPVTLAALLGAVTGVEVTCTSTLPSGICEDCYHDLVPIVPFVNMCKEFAEQWNQITDYLNSVTPHKNTSSVYIHIGDEHITHREVPRRRETSLANPRSKPSRTEIDMTCPQCEKEFSTIGNYNRHLKTLRKKMCTECLDVVDIEQHQAHMATHQIYVYRCDVCYNTFRTEDEHRAHTAKHGDGDERCLECGATFDSYKRLRYHMTVHKQRKCGCDRKFSNHKCYVFHSSKCRFTKVAPLFICDYCGRQFERKNSLRWHIAIHMFGKRFPCKECGKKFVSQSNLNMHSNTHNKVADRYVCECGAKFSTKSGYNRHVQPYTVHEIDSEGNSIVTVRPHSNAQEGKIIRFVCACGAKYATKKSFDAHEKTHEDPKTEKPVSASKPEPRFVCGCGAKYRAKISFVNHQIRFWKHGVCSQSNSETYVPRRHWTSDANRVRTPRPSRVVGEMKCPQCEKKFSSIFCFNRHLKNLRKKMCTECHEIVDIKHHQAHMRVHQIFVYRCEVCYSTFWKESAYLVHKAKHDDARDRCPECGKTFDEPEELRLHMVVHKARRCGCNKKFSYQKCYAFHSRRCRFRKVPLYICDYCGQRFTIKTSMRIHVAAHIYGKRFQCELCGKQFGSQANLLEHGNTHDKVEDRHVCECGAKFSTRSGFRRHLRRYTVNETDSEGNSIAILCKHSNKQEKDIKFVCECGAKYSSNKSYKRHQKTHDTPIDISKSEARFVCECGAKYRTKRSFVNHQNSHINKDNFKLVEAMEILESDCDSKLKFVCECGATYSTMNSHLQHQRCYSNYDHNLVQIIECTKA